VYGEFPPGGPTKPRALAARKFFDRYLALCPCLGPRRLSLGHFLQMLALFAEPRGLCFLAGIEECVLQVCDLGRR